MARGERYQGVEACIEIVELEMRLSLHDICAEVLADLEY